VPNLFKADLLQQLRHRFGELRKLPESQSLFILGNDAAWIYYRYSKVHEARRTFFGLREVDLRRLEGHNSFLCLQLDDGSDPLFIPYADFEEIFHASEPASDGQYKVQVFSSEQWDLKHFKKTSIKIVCANIVTFRIVRYKHFSRQSDIARDMTYGFLTTMSLNWIGH
jgi:hypothetical protein